MSKKTIVIKMPVADAADVRAPSVEPDEGASPSAALAGGAADSDEVQADRWIRAEGLVALAEVLDEPSAPPAPSPLRFAPLSATLDLAADRTFAEAMTLGFMLPSMLGWFWLANTLDRYRRLLAA